MMENITMFAVNYIATYIDSYPIALSKFIRTSNAIASSSMYFNAMKVTGI